MDAEKDKASQGPSRQQNQEVLGEQCEFELKHRLLANSSLGKNSTEGRTRIMENLISAKSTAQAARCEDLMARIRTIELSRIKSHLTKQFKYLENKMDSKPADPKVAENTLSSLIDKSSSQTDYNNALLDIIQQEIKDDVSGEYDEILKNDEVFSHCRTMFHRTERQALEETCHVLTEVIRNALPDNTETDSSSEDESEREAFMYKPVAKDKVRQYRPIESTPLAKWAKYRSHFISSWAWLDHAIAETDFRLKKQQALYNHMRRAKPTFQLEPPQPSTSTSFMSVKVKDIEGVSVFNNPGETPSFHLRFANNSDKVKSDSLPQRTSPVRVPGPSFSNPSYQSVDRSESLNLLADACLNHESLRRESGKDLASKSHKIPRPTDSINQCIQLSSTEDEVDSTQVASRCRALKPCKPRKIYKMNGISHFMNEVFEPIQIGDCPCQFGEACILCLGEKYKEVPEDYYKSYKDKLAHLDPYYHKSLSTPDELPMEMLLYRSMENMDINEDLEDMDNLKLFTSAGPNEYRSENIQEEQKARAMSPSEITKRGRGRPPAQSYNNDMLPDISNSNYMRKRMSNSNLQAPKKKKPYKRRKQGRVARKKKAYSDDSGDDSAEICQPSTSAASYKRTNTRRNQDYDIDNIVSHSSGAIVKRLEYKEIIIPNYRVIEYEPLFDNDIVQRHKKEGAKRCRRFLRHRDYNEIEELDDEVYKMRHDICEEEERRKFSSFCYKQSNRRRRLKSKTENTDAGEKQAEVEVHEVSPPNTPLTSDGYFNDESHLQVISSEEASVAASALKVSSGRRRTISSSKKDDEEPDECLIAPWPSRDFPLSAEEYQDMVKDNPEEHKPQF